MTPPRVLRPGFMLRSVRSIGRRPRLTTATVDAVLEAFCEPRGGRIMIPRDGGGRSASVILETVHGRRVLKRYKHAVRDEAIVHEHSVLLHLARIGFGSSVRVVARPGDGGTLVTIDGDRYALFEFIPGAFQYYRYLMTPDARRAFVGQAGDLLARFHAALRDFTPSGMNWNGIDPTTGRRERDLHWYLERLERCRRSGQDSTDTVVRELVRRADALGDELARLESRLEAAGLDRQVIHGDFGPHNLLFRDAAPPVVIDLEISRLDWRPLEVANALWRFGFDERRGARLADMATFLDAYQERLPLAQPDLALLADLWRFSHVRRVISNWDLMAGASEPDARRKVGRHLAMIDWMNADAPRFRSIVPSPVT